MATTAQPSITPRERALDLCLIGAGLALRLPLLRVGRFADDWYHLAMCEGRYALPRPPWGLYDFLRDLPSEHAAVLASGTFPWWTAPDLQLSPWRPLASLSLWFDHALFGRSALAPHVVALLLWLAILMVAARWFRATLPGAAATLALAALALDDSATVPIAWIASRGALLSSLLGLTGAWCLARARFDVRWSFGASIAFAASLAAGEYGLATIVGAVACDVATRDDPWRDRARAAAPHLALCAAYLIAWKALGHGVRGTLAYVDPIADTARWISVAPGRALALAIELALGAKATDAAASPGASLVALAALVALVTVAARRATAHERRHLVGLAVAVGVSLIAVASAPVSGRVLFAAAPFFAALLGLVAQLTWRADPPRAWTLRGAVALVALVHLVIAPLRALVEGRELAARTATLPVWRAGEGLDACAEADHDHILLAAGGFSTLHVAPLTAVARGCVPSRTWRVLTAPTGAAIALRTGDRTLRIEAQTGTLFGSDARLWRTGRFARAGDRVTLRGFEAVVEAVEGDAPTRVHFTFDRSLDDARVTLWIATPEGFSRVPAAPVGAGAMVPRPVEHYP